MSRITPFKLIKVCFHLPISGYKPDWPSMSPFKFCPTKWVKTMVLEVLSSLNPAVKPPTKDPSTKLTSSSLMLVDLSVPSSASCSSWATFPSCPSNLTSLEGSSSTKKAKKLKERTSICLHTWPISFTKWVLIVDCVKAGKVWEKQWSVRRRCSSNLMFSLFCKESVFFKESVITSFKRKKSNKDLSINCKLYGSWRKGEENTGRWRTGQINKIITVLPVQKKNKAKANSLNLKGNLGILSSTSTWQIYRKNHNTSIKIERVGTDKKEINNCLQTKNKCKHFRLMLSAEEKTSIIMLL